MAAFSQWLQLMLAEIARKGEDTERAQQEEVKRKTETLPADTPGSSPPPPQQ